MMRCRRTAPWTWALGLLALVLLFTGCEELFHGKAPIWKTYAPPEGTPWMDTLIYYGQEAEPIGRVWLSFTDEHIYFKISVLPDYEDEWWLKPDSEVHFHIQTDSHNFPKNPSGYDYHFYIPVPDESLTTFIGSVPWEDEWLEAETLFVGVKASFLSIYGNDETGTAGWPWGYFWITTLPKTLKLPTGTIEWEQLDAINEYPCSLRITNSSTDDDLPSGDYRAFCIDPYHYIDPDGEYTGYALSWYDQDNPLMPDAAKYIWETTDPIPVDKICWLINHIPPENQDEATAEQMQNVIFVLLGMKSYGALDYWEQELYDLVDEEGEGYFPYSSDGDPLWIPVVLVDEDYDDDPEDVQLVIIQVDP